MLEIVQETVAIIAPQSPIVTAEGESLENLHAFIRTMAHFMEFALLGALACGCCLAYMQDYTKEKKYFFIGAGSLILVPIIDEFLQSFTANRAAEFIDFAVDVSGGGVGFALTLAFFYGILFLIKKAKTKK